MGKTIKGTSVILSTIKIFKNKKRERERNT